MTGFSAHALVFDGRCLVQLGTAWCMSICRLLLVHSPVVLLSAKNVEYGSGLSLGGRMLLQSVKSVVESSGKEKRDFHRTLNSGMEGSALNIPETHHHCMPLTD